MSVKEDIVAYLKKVSKIPSTFIEDMFSFYDPETTQTDFVVNLDAVSKWLNIKKFNLLKTLKLSYTKKDFKIIKIQNPRLTGKYGKNSYKQVLLTPDCFKRLCMRSKGTVSEHVRTYFIELESLLIKYRMETMIGMRNEMLRMERNKTLRKFPKVTSNGTTGYIYVLRASNKYDTVVKIGRTRDLIRRLREHAGALAEDPEILHIYKTDNVNAVESCVKAWLKEKQWNRAKYKEVYNADLDMVRKLVSKCDNSDLLKLHSKNKTQLGGFASSDKFFISIFT